MKVRWRQGSLRLRIGPSELEALRRDEPVREELMFPGGRSWAVIVRPAATSTGIDLDGNDAILALSAHDLANLADPATEGVYFQCGDGPARLQFFIEKDFPCLHPRPVAAAEAPADTFVAPAEFAARHTPRTRSTP